MAYRRPCSLWISSDLIDHNSLVHDLQLANMSTPHRHLSVDQLSHRASTGLAIRRGDIKISDPIPSSYVHNGAEMDGMLHQTSLANTGIASWSVKPGIGISHGRSGSAPLSSHPAHVSRFTERTSPGASVSGDDTSLSRRNEPFSQRRNTGLRASLKRMFSKKSHPATALRRGAHNSVSPHCFGSNHHIANYRFRTPEDFSQSLKSRNTLILSPRYTSPQPHLVIHSVRTPLLPS